ncbi:hypothetical protein D3C73_1279770 [compost metagenome]
MAESGKALILQRDAQQISDRRQNIQLAAGTFHRLPLHARHMHNQRDIKAADPRVVRDAQRILHLLRRDILRLQAEMVTVQHKYRVLPQPLLLQSVNQCANGIIRVINRSQIIAKHRALKLLRQDEPLEAVRNLERMMARGRN